MVVNNQNVLCTKHFFLELFLYKIAQYKAKKY